jgi:hypothetical protein
MIARLLAALGGDLVHRLGGPIGEAARAAAPISPGERAELIAAAVAPRPDAHPSWLSAVPEAPGPAGVWLARRDCADLPPLPRVRSIVRPDRRTDVAAMSAHALVAWLEAVGADQVAYAASLAGPAALAELVARRPALRAAAGRIAEPPRSGQLGPGRAAIARCAGGQLLAIGARAVAPHLDAITARQVTLRLPRDHAVGEELRVHASDAGAPSWAAVIA